MVDTPTRRGEHVPAYSTSIGNALVALSPPSMVEAVIDAGLRPRTMKTSTWPPRVREHLAKVRERGVAYDVEGIKLGGWGISAAVLLAGQPVAVVAVGAPTSRLHPPSVAALLRESWSRLRAPRTREN